MAGVARTQPRKPFLISSVPQRVRCVSVRSSERMNEAHSSLKSLMAGLYYPAVLGAGFFAILARLPTQGPALATDVTFYFALILLFYFSASFLLTHYFPANSYTVAIFLLDLIEVALLTFAFARLG